LRKYVAATDVSGIVVQRLKRTPTIIDKLKNRQQSMDLGRMQDVGGLRAIVSDVPDVRKIEENFAHFRAKHHLKKTYDYIAEPKESGYRGIHLVYEYHNPRNVNYDGLLVEIQLRTRLQHLWATAVETVGFFFQESLKSSQGNEKRLEFFQLVSALFAHEEGQPTSALLRPFSREVLVQRLRQFEEKNAFLPTLNAIQAVRSIEVSKQSDTEYWIIQTKLDPPETMLIPFPESHWAVASFVYRMMETPNEKGRSQTVLVRADSVAKLEKAYPNFFLHIDDFIEKVYEIMS
jgi:hypothetical protein